MQSTVDAFPGANRQGVGRNDLLQLSAYATRYEAAANVLLYPQSGGAVPEEFHLPLGPPGLQAIQVRQVELRRDLHAERDRVVEELRAIVAPAFQSDVGVA